MNKSQLHRWIITLSLVGLLLLPTGLFAQYTFKTYAAPTSKRDLSITGINNIGRMVGGYADRNGYYRGIVIFPTGYALIALPNARDVYPRGINNHNEITGEAQLVRGAVRYQAFVRYSNKTVRIYNFTGAMFTSGYGSNDFGVKVGSFFDGSKVHGYTLTQSGKRTMIDVPGAMATTVFGINNQGQMVGNYVQDGIVHGFFLDNGNLAVIDYPGGIHTSITAINNLGQMVGASADDTAVHGFVYYQGSFTLIEPPGEITGISGINDQGVIVGSYATDQNYGFVATPIHAD